MEYIIHKDWRGWGVWEATPDWREYNSLEYFATRQQAEDYEETLLERDRCEATKSKQKDEEVKPGRGEDL